MNRTAKYIFLIFVVLLLCAYAFLPPVTWTVQNRMKPVMLSADSALVLPRQNVLYSGFNNIDSTGSIFYYTTGNKFYGKFLGITAKPFATEDSVFRTLDAVLRAGNTTTRNVFFTDTSKIRWDKFTDYAFIQYYSTADVGGGSNLLFSFGDNPYYGLGLPREGFIFRKDTAGLLGAPAQWDTLQVMNDTEVRFPNRVRTNPALFFINRLNNMIGVNTNNPLSRVHVQDGDVAILNGVLNVASAGTDLQVGGNATTLIRGIGNNGTAGYAEVQGLYGGVSFTAPLVFQRLGGRVGIATNTPNSTMHVNGSTAYTVRTTTVSTSLGDADHFLTCNNTSAIVVTIPTASSVTGREYVVTKINGATANVTITPSGGLINGSASVIITSNLTSVTTYSDGINWYVH